MSTACLHHGCFKNASTGMYVLHTCMQYLPYSLLFPVHCSACMSLHEGEPIYIWLLCQFSQNTNSSTACLGKSKENLVCSVINPQHWLLGYIRAVKYRIAPNFRGIKFSRIGLLQIFAEINFADEGFPLATPI